MTFEIQLKVNYMLFSAVVYISNQNITSCVRLCEKDQKPKGRNLYFIIFAINNNNNNNNKSVYIDGELVSKQLMKTLHLKTYLQ